MGAGIHETSRRLAALAALARRTSSFDDPAPEIADLSARIKRDISGLNGALADLATLGGRGAGVGAHARAHSATVVDSLRSRLKDAASQFKGVLDARQAALEAGADRRARFSAAPAASARAAPAPSAASRQAPLFGGPTPRPPPGGTDETCVGWGAAGTHVGASASGGARQRPAAVRAPADARCGVDRGAGRCPLLARRGGGRPPPSRSLSRPLLASGPASTLSHRPPPPPAFGGAQAQATLAAPQNTYLASRAGALQQVESTIAELGGIFQQLATLVAEQGETAIRIDEHVGDALANVDGAQAQLLRHLATISSNRWLILKCLGVLLVFALFIVFVVA